MVDIYGIGVSTLMKFSMLPAARANPVCAFHDSVE